MSVYYYSIRTRFFSRKTLFSLFSGFFFVFRDLPKKQLVLYKRSVLLYRCWFFFFFFQDQLSRFVPRLVQLLAEWTDKFPYDFRDERVMTHVREITHQCVSVEPAVRHQVSAMLQTLLHRLTALDKYETFLQQTGTDATVGISDALSPVSYASPVNSSAFGTSK